MSPNTSIVALADQQDVCESPQKESLQHIYARVHGKLCGITIRKEVNAETNVSKKMHGFVQKACLESNLYVSDKYHQILDDMLFAIAECDKLQAELSATTKTLLH